MDFYGTVLGLELGFCDPERRVAFYWIGSGRDSMLGVWEHLPWAASCDDKRIERQHLAFQVSFNDLQPIIERAKQRGMRLTNYFEEITDEPSVFAWIPAASIYFNDPDGHLLEFIAKLEGEPAPDLGVVSLEQWQIRSRNQAGRRAQ
jgi:catechol 2,3-dioxygenase-like lactoylglutathione lyase family enzyme